MNMFLWKLWENMSQQSKRTAKMAFVALLAVTSLLNFVEWYGGERVPDVLYLALVVGAVWATARYGDFVLDTLRLARKSPAHNANEESPTQSELELAAEKHGKAEASAK